MSTDSFIVLAFRGTESTSIRDIKTDARANTRNCPKGGKVHSGFDSAFYLLQNEIETTIALPEYRDKPLYVTGHSLGGALATVASRKLEHNAGIAACYTFGAPRVGDDEWVEGIKTPVYRIVNAADCVPFFPPNGDVVQGLAWLFRFVPWGGKTISHWLLSKFSGYMHGGNMRYLSNCPAGDYSEVKLLYSVSWFYRSKGYFIKEFTWKKFLADHSISVYRRKLGVVALRRNGLLK